VRLLKGKEEKGKKKRNGAPFFLYLPDSYLDGSELKSPKQEKKGGRRKKKKRRKRGGREMIALFFFFFSAEKPSKKLAEKKKGKKKKKRKKKEVKERGKRGMQAKLESPFYQ